MWNQLCVNTEHQTCKWTRQFVTLIFLSVNFPHLKLLLCKFWPYQTYNPYVEVDHLSLFKGWDHFFSRGDKIEVIREIHWTLYNVNSTLWSLLYFLKKICYSANFGFFQTWFCSSLDESWDCTSSIKEAERVGTKLSRGSPSSQEVPRLLLQSWKPGQWHLHVQSLSKQ